MKKGRPAWKAKNPEQARFTVVALVGLGTPVDTIARLLDPPCSGDTLHRHYEVEIKVGASLLRARAEATLARLALGTPEIKIGKRIVQKAVSPDKASLFFLLKTRFNYRETSTPVLSFDSSIDIASLSDVQLAQLMERINSAVASLKDEEENSDTEPHEQVRQRRL